MAGHSKFKNIMHRKGAQDNKRAKVFTKVVREIIVAAKTGIPDPQLNSRLRVAIAAAKDVNLPKDKIEAAIKKATTAGCGDNYDEIRYEGYGPCGTAVIVEAMTDNRNRTSSEVRSTFSKFGGNLGETGCVSYLFKHKGLISYPTTIDSYDNLISFAIETEAEDCEQHGDEFIILCDIVKFHDISDKLEAKYGQASRSLITWLPLTEVSINSTDEEKVLKFLDHLDDLDDVQNVYINAEIESGKES